MESRDSAKRRVTAPLHVKECERRSDAAVQGHGLSANVRRSEWRLRTAADLGNGAEPALPAGTRCGDEAPGRAGYAGAADLAVLIGGVDRQAAQLVRQLPETRCPGWPKTGRIQRRNVL